MRVKHRAAPLNTHTKVVYVKIMASTVDSYLNMSLSPLERVEKAWYAKFFCQVLEGVDTGK